MNSSTGTIAGIGSSAPSSGNNPNTQSRKIRTPVASEYEMRPPAAFQPGCPM
jgi:hypothetical protein